MTPLGQVAPSERRLGPDRRRRNTPVLSRYWLRGRRRAGRRDDERDRIYVDRYASLEWILVLGILALAIADITLTGLHLDAGGSEANPWLDWVLQQAGFPAMAAIKLAITSSALFLLLLHIRWPLVRPILFGLLALHIAVLAWHAVVTLDRLTP